MEKRWVVYPKTSDDLKKQLLANRDIEKAEIFLKPLLIHLTPIWKLFPEIEKAVDRIKTAIKNKELIYVYGDYDVDGITGSAILWETINFLGGKVMPYIPSRHSEGYGLHSEALEQLAKEGSSVVISVDCGITAVEQANVARKLGIDLIITDHHQPQDELPKPFALIHTTTLSGSGVAFRLAESLLVSFGRDKEEQFFKNLELAALGTVADMVPLKSDNRILVQNGLTLLSKTARLGLRSLYEESGIGKVVGTYEIGFLISPRLNAMGRMENALDSLRLLLTKDKERAQKLAIELGKTNKARQEQTQTALEHAKKQVEEKFYKNRFLIVDSESYPEGVVGLVASRLVEAFYKPTAVLGKGENFYKGSARSISSFNITKALHTQENILIAHGGHPMAAGFSIEGKNIALLRNNLEEVAQSEISEENLVPELKVDAEITLEEINADLLDLVKEFEPFGIGNPEPVFLTKSLEVVAVRLVGKENNHIKLTLKNKAGLILEGIGFGLFEKKPSVGELIDVVYNIRENYWNSQKRLEARIKDLRRSR